MANREIKLTPQTANTLNKICKLPKDNISTRQSWMLLNGDGKTLTLIRLVVVIGLELSNLHTKNLNDLLHFFKQVNNLHQHPELLNK